jgi:cytochrome c553
MSILRKVASSIIFFSCFNTIQTNATELSAVEKKASVCFGCHGNKGKSNSPQWPSLAGQQSVYIVNQLNAFKSGSRVNSLMQAQATGMSDEDINNFGAYFVVQEAAKAGGDAKLASIGKDKAAMCLGCHGNAGEGNGQFPRLAGQHPDYLVVQLQKFKSGERKNGMMQAIAGNLTDEDMKALAAYFGSL